MAQNPSKLFVGGLNSKTDGDYLNLHFSKYGQVKETLIVMDKETGSSRGFGFVTFEDHSAADTAFRDQHFILGKKVDVKWATPRNPCHNSQEQNTIDPIQSNGDENDNRIELRTKKIFVGGLPHDISNEEFKDFFSTFGTVRDAVVMYNGVTGRSRGFGFVTFDSEDSADTVLRNKYYQLKDCQIEVKMAKPRSENDKQSQSHNQMVPYYLYGSEIPSLYLVLADDRQATPPFININGYNYYGPNSMFRYYSNGAYYINNYHNKVSAVTDGDGLEHHEKPNQPSV
ncbi:heterogeneous nuclear ribonucleoprotein 1 [Ricinus communis]|uniref:heterogeneous nuclear ribonucleoprotein 1 n=1 Tax=Ricinus communis TaxID=3988 RepID=UPI00201A3897|nr:heterogeneous nuclear ribonucleoprotein 1 [Ricinus communis]